MVFLRFHLNLKCARNYFRLYLLTLSKGAAAMYEEVDYVGLQQTA